MLYIMGPLGVIWKMSVMDKLVQWVGAVFLESFVGRQRVETTYSETWVESPAGCRLYAHIHRPATDGPYPGVVFVPGGMSSGTDYDGGTEVTADDVASLGFVVLHYDPSGRGRTGGEENHWGHVHQQELAIVLEHLANLPGVVRNNIGVFSFSIGIGIAAGALAEYSLPFVKYIFDWEGPSNRINITKNDTHKPLENFPSSNLEFWRYREAARFMGDVECGYFRYQSQRDHVQGNYKGHAIELVNLAAKGKAKWTQLNDNPMNIILDPDRIDAYRWVPPYRNHKGQILKYFLEAQAVE
jgi:hypothetical protein